MKNLLRADFYRILKHKLTLISAILAASIPLLLSLLFLAIRGAANSLLGDGFGDVMGEAYLNGKTLMNGIFSLNNNIGLVLPIFCTILILSDITSGTIRNKIIHGYNRHAIFFSQFFTTFIYAFVIMFVYALCTTGFGCLILGFGPEKVPSGAIVSYAYYFGLGFITLLFICAACCFYSMSLMNGAGAIILTIVTCLVFGVVGSLLSNFYVLFSKDIYVVIARMVPSMVTSCIGDSFPTYIEDAPKYIDWKMFLEGVAGVFAFGGIFYAGGTFIFSRNDLK